MQEIIVSLIEETFDFAHSVLDLLSTHVITGEGSFAFGFAKTQQAAEEEQKHYVDLNTYNELTNAIPQEEYEEDEEEDMMEAKPSVKVSSVTSSFGFRG